MTNKALLQAVPDEKPEQLTYWQIDRLARSLAFDLTNAGEGTLKTVLLLMQEIASHPFDHSYVETVANLTAIHIFAVTREADDACKELVDRERRKIIGKGDAT